VWGSLAAGNPDASHSTSTNNHPVWGNLAAGNPDAFHVYK